MKVENDVKSWLFDQAGPSPAVEGPRERLIRRGANSLEDVELVALLLRTGSDSSSALEVAKDILRRTGGLEGMAHSDPVSIATRGVGPAKLCTLLAALEVARRLARSGMVDRRRLSNPSAVARYLALRYGGSDQEVMGALYLDARQRLMRERELFRGTRSRASVCPSLILRQALLCSASAVVLFHNHPSGDPSPSAEDLRFTRRLSDAGDLMGIHLADHLILGEAGRFLSLRERGGW
jgi:DNA repair protein RadC